ncbi:hypothetical protein [Fodinibius saliphilus]|uniref:hypothetical protein n=1 Tax=Fodinibius saliphilus TaxID=1920650 RepID=UPI001108B325|nr:hypothetical protein [Fodinibius saliphilus]
MKYEILLSILNLTLLGRLHFMLRDEALDWKGVLRVEMIPFLALPFLQVNIGWFLLVCYFIGISFLMWGTEKEVWKLRKSRGFLLVFQLVLVALICSPLTSLQANNLTTDIVGSMDQILLADGAIKTANFVAVQGLLFGFLLVLNEMNILLRYLLRVLGVKSLGDDKKQVDDEEYSTGRIIGLLERIFVFIFVLLGHYTAIGFILAAKGVARLIDIKSRDFAEYVLIGTLLSTLLAMTVGYVVKLII